MCEKIQIKVQEPKNTPSKYTHHIIKEVLYSLGKLEWHMDTPLFEFNNVN